MKIYDEITLEEIFEPDLEKGYIHLGTRKIGETEEEIKVIEGTVTDSRPNGIREIVPAHDITEQCQYYHRYTEEELNPKPTDYATWTELAAAYKKGVELA